VGLKPPPLGGRSGVVRERFSPLLPPGKTERAAMDGGAPFPGKGVWGGSGGEGGKPGARLSRTERRAPRGGGLRPTPTRPRFSRESEGEGGRGANGDASIRRRAEAPKRMTRADPLSDDPPTPERTDHAKHGLHHSQGATLYLHSQERLRPRGVQNALRPRVSS
jgi:hypothetical protein